MISLKSGYSTTSYPVYVQMFKCVHEYSERLDNWDDLVLPDSKKISSAVISVSPLGVRNAAVLYLYAEEVVSGKYDVGMSSRISGILHNRQHGMR